MKRYNSRIESWFEWHSEEPYTELQTSESKTGEWVKATDALKLQRRINRMQERIDKLEGRTE